MKNLLRGSHQLRVRSKCQSSLNSLPLHVLRYRTKWSSTSDVGAKAKAPRSRSLRRPKETCLDDEDMVVGCKRRRPMRELVDGNGEWLCRPAANHLPLRSRANWRIKAASAQKLVFFEQP